MEARLVGRLINQDEFQIFVEPLVGLPVSHLWQGYGSSLFLECGLLTPGTRRKKDGMFGNPVGEFTLMIEWSWRIEGKRRIWCGSWDDDDRWPRFFSYLKGATVTDVALIGRLPEIDVTFSNGLHLVSFMTFGGYPVWGVIRRDGDKAMSVGVHAGRLELLEKRNNR